MPARKAWLLVARTASQSNPRDTHEIKTDGVTLGCDCGRWRFSSAPKTCHHVEEVKPRVDAIGGCQVVHRMLQSGFSMEIQHGIAVPRVPPGRQSPSPRLREPHLTLQAFERQLRERGHTPPFDRCEELVPVRALYAMFGSGQARAAAPPPSAPGPDWLGGTRAIILRD